MKCRVVGILDMDGNPLNIATLTYILELEERIKKLENKVN